MFHIPFYFLPSLDSIQQRADRKCGEDVCVWISLGKNFVYISKKAWLKWNLSNSPSSSAWSNSTGEGGVDGGEQFSSAPYGYIFSRFIPANPRVFKIKPCTLILINSAMRHIIKTLCPNTKQVWLSLCIALHRILFVNTGSVKYGTPSCHVNKPLI